MPRPERLLATLFALLLPLCAYAQAWQCRPPVMLTLPLPEQRPADEPVRRSAIGGYTLALSWSPEYCRTRKNSPRDAVQCAGKTGDFGFVLHGLWPEARRGAYPQWCRTAAPIPRAIVRENICMTPSPQLMQHEWAKHGTCMARSPSVYFRTARVLFEALDFPDMDRLSRSKATAGSVVTAFTAVNPGLRPEMLQILANRRGWLTEVRLCLGEDFRPRRCRVGQGGLPGNASIKIWRSL